MIGAPQKAIREASAASGLLPTGVASNRLPSIEHGELRDRVACLAARFVDEISRIASETGVTSLRCGDIDEVASHHLVDSVEDSSIPVVVSIG